MSCSKTEVTDVTINFDYPDDTNVSESIFFKNNLEKSLEECLMNHS
jgi:hypothetical protein